MIRIDNIDKTIPVSETIRLKPFMALVLFFALGISCYALDLPYSEVGLFVSIVAVFFFIALPDRIVLQFTDRSVYLYSRENEAEVRILYYDEIRSYRYESGRKYDVLRFDMVDGTSYSIEVFGKRKLKKILEVKLPFKDGSIKK